MPINKKETDRVAANLNPSAGARQIETTPNPGNESQAAVLDPVRTNGLYVGTVVASFPSAYCCSVRIHGANLSIPCTVACKGNGASIGTGMNEAWLPIEGSDVLVYKPDGKVRHGIIIATLPPMVEQANTDSTRRWLVPSVDPEPGAAFVTEKAYWGPYDDPDDMNTLNINAARPMDLFPGQAGSFNEMGLGTYTGTLNCGMRAAEMAGIDFFVLDELVRLCSRQFQHYHGAGETQIYDDGGYQTQEHSGTPHLCELLGLRDYKPWMTDDVFDPALMKNSCKKTLADNQYSHKRYQLIAGHMGNLLTLLVSKPDPDIETNTYETENKDQGLFSCNVDNTGRLIISSANDIIIEHTDHIPVPKKLREPWDPEGDRVDEDDPFKLKEPFNWTTSADLQGRALWLDDSLAWYKKLLYQRHDETPIDWYTPEESDMVTPDDDVETIGKQLTREDYSKRANRRAQICLGADGTITLRSDGGAEIVLAGGDIQFNAPGDIQFNAGGKIISLGRDIISKAKDSVDITATDKDVRIKAEKNLHMYSKNSILLQSDATVDTHNWDEDPTGTEQQHGGIVIQAKNSRVLVHGMVAHIAGKSKIIMETLDDVIGTIYSVTKNIINLFSSGLFGGAKGAGLRIDGDATLYGKSVSTIGATGNNMQRGQKSAIIGTWGDTGTSPYDTIREGVDTLTDTYLEGTEWLQDYTPEKRDKIQFTHRTSEQLGTDKEEFKVYEPYWAYMLRSGRKPDWLNKHVEDWKERDVKGTYPWPGEAAYDGGKVLRRLTKENNWDSSYTKPKPRADRKAEGGTIEAVDMNTYPITKG